MHKKRDNSVKRRLNLKLDKELAEWAFSYAEIHSTSVTQLIADYFFNLKKLESEAASKDAEQI